MEISATLATSSPTVSKIFRRGAVQKLGLRVDLGKCYALRILLQKLASTQPRTSPGKIANFREIFGNFGDAGDFFADRFEKFSTRGGAKAGGAWRSRQMLHVAYFVAKYGLYPAENEPLHFQNFRNFSKIFKNFKFSKIFKNFQNFQNFRKFSKNFQRRPIASERIQVHPNASEQVQTGPSRSGQVRKLKKT